jgi:hypothetical protein
MRTSLYAHKSMSRIRRGALSTVTGEVADIPKVHEFGSKSTMHRIVRRNSLNLTALAATAPFAAFRECTFPGRDIDFN